MVRFRTYKIALTGDIERAFLMVSVTKSDRDALRFLDVDDVNSKIRVMRFARVVLGVTASPFLLNATINFHLECKREKNETLVQKLQRSFYVDDLIFGAASEGEGYDLYLESKQLLHEGGFNLRKFTTNSPLLRVIERAESAGGNSLDKRPSDSDSHPIDQDTTQDVAPVPCGFVGDSFQGLASIRGVRPGRVLPSGVSGASQ